MKIVIETGISVLSDKSRVHKTEGFLKATRRFADFDKFLSKATEAVLLHFEGEPKESFQAKTFKLETPNREHTLFFAFGDGTSCLSPWDVVFFRYIGANETARRNDQSFVLLMRNSPQQELELQAVSASVPHSELQKLYLLSWDDTVNFPLLNDTQRRIVTTEDSNMLVQGVAGSGKTNVCIDKIVYSACREYRSKVLYSTFSRGLLLDTKKRVDVFRENLLQFAREFRADKIIFLGKDHKKAVENRLGIFFSVNDDDKICDKVERVAAFLSDKVDYMLIEDLYARSFPGDRKTADENYFSKVYVRDIKNHQLSGKLAKISHLSFEIVYKEIYGLIFGSCKPEAPALVLSLEEYVANRRNSFSRTECETIYQVAMDYGEHLKREGLFDNNSMSRKMLAAKIEQPPYALAVLDEVQDMTEVNLCLMKTLAIKLFCVGDALQMINPSYFGFAYLKRLLFEKDVSSVTELKHNYRNTRRIADIIEELEKINVSHFGTHSFVLKGDSPETDVPTSAVYVREKRFLQELAGKRLDSVTFVVNGLREKEALRRVLKSQEILTVSEIKGLERDVVVLFNVLSDNADKWHALERALINRKTADENSVYRYYFNLFYVGISRAKAHLVVYEEKEVASFQSFLHDNFSELSAETAAEELAETAGRIEVNQEEISERIAQFISLEQYDNARFAASKLVDDAERRAYLVRIDVNETYVRHGNYRDAGIAFWEANLIDDAREMFSLGGDTALVELLDACGGGEHALDIDIVGFYPDVESNETARKLVLQTVQKDLASLKQKQSELQAKLKKSANNR